MEIRVPESNGDVNGMFTYTLKTQADETRGVITQVLELAGKELAVWVVETRERAVRAALVSLGWTPPSGGS